uniref:Uncharacterized protein n=1 Tax=Aegilops tauschii TaxID=37682 RepID=M8B505_AEGTA
MGKKNLEDIGQEIAHEEMLEQGLRCSAQAHSQLGQNSADANAGGPADVFEY